VRRSQRNAGRKEKTMQKRIGIWIDNKKAVIVAYGNPEKKPVVREVQSDVERHVRLSGGSRTKRTPWGPQQISSDSTMQARHRQQLRRFHQRIVKEIRGAYKIMLMGPGEAKLGLKKEIDQSKALSESLVHMETCDKMTQNQLSAHVREFFLSVP
jgi:hypothetical protein